MNIGDLIPAERITVPLPGKTLHDAAEQLVESCVATGLTTDGPALVDRIGQTPPRDAVTVGDYAFILHFRSEAATAIGAALGVTAEPIRLSTDSQRTACIVVLLIAPPTEASIFLQAVSVLDQALAQDEIGSRVAEAKSAADVLAVSALFETELPGRLMVRDVMATRPRSVWPDATLDEAARVMVANRLTAIPVTSEQGEVLGLLTHKAILETVLPRYLRRSSGEIRPSGDTSHEDPRWIPVREVMDRSVLCLSEDQTLADVATTLTGKDVDRFPVVREGVLVGLLTRRDVVRRLFGP